MSGRLFRRPFLLPSAWAFLARLAFFLVLSALCATLFGLRFALEPPQLALASAALLPTRGQNALLGVPRDPVRGTRQRPSSVGGGRLAPVFLRPDLPGPVRLPALAVARLPVCPCARVRRRGACSMQVRACVACAAMSSGWVASLFW